MKLVSTLFTLLFMLVILAGAGAFGAYTWLKGEITKPGAFSEDTTIIVPPGQSLSGLSAVLEQDGLVSDARLMRLAARLDLIPTDIKTGEYVIPAGASPTEIVAQLVAGDVVLHRITIPEGLTTKQVLARIAADPMLEGDMPDLELGEGELLPETYSFSRGTTRAEIIEIMADAQDALIDRLWEARTDGVAVSSKEEALILASIVQKEAAGPDEYGNVASVFSNRLRKGMKLETDPTVIYGITGGEPLYNRRGQRRTLLRSELDRDTPYNTYTREGLPPTPIASPGMGAIEAVLDPPDTEYIFFVANPEGGTTFTTNYRDHQRAVEIYARYRDAEIARERAE